MPTHLWLSRGVSPLAKVFALYATNQHCLGCLGTCPRVVGDLGPKSRRHPDEWLNECKHKDTSMRPCSVRVPADTCGTSGEPSGFVTVREGCSGLPLNVYCLSLCICRCSRRPHVVAAEVLELICSSAVIDAPCSLLSACSWGNSQTHVGLCFQVPEASN